MTAVFSLSDYLGFESVFWNLATGTLYVQVPYFQFNYAIVATFLRVDSSVSCRISTGLLIIFPAAKWSAD